MLMLFSLDSRSDQVPADLPTFVTNPSWEQWLLRSKSITGTNILLGIDRALLFVWKLNQKPSVVNPIRQDLVQRCDQTLRVLLGET